MKNFTVYRTLHRTLRKLVRYQRSIDISNPRYESITRAVECYKNLSSCQNLLRSKMKRIDTDKIGDLTADELAAVRSANMREQWVLKIEAMQELKSMGFVQPIVHVNANTVFEVVSKTTSMGRSWLLNDDITEYLYKGDSVEVFELDISRSTGFLDLITCGDIEVIYLETGFIDCKNARFLSGI